MDNFIVILKGEEVVKTPLGKEEVVVDEKIRK
jgi:hypothetical protein